MIFLMISEYVPKNLVPQWNLRNKEKYTNILIIANEQFPVLLALPPATNTCPGTVAGV